MKSLFDSWKRKKGLDLETELRAARPQAPERLVRSIAASINPRPVRARNRRSLGFVGALGVATLAMLGATGGFSYAAGGVANAVHAAAKVVNVSPPPRPPSHAPVPSKPNSGSSSSCAQYGHTATVTSVSPSFGVAGSSATIAIHGTNLQGASSVTLAGQTVTIKSVNSTGTTVLVTLANVTTTSGSTGPAVVSTCVGDATGGTFTIIAAPAITDFSNANDDKNLQTGQVVTITGSGFTGVAKNGVKFQTKTSTDATVVDDGTITATVPVGLPATGFITVTNKAGHATSTASFTYSSTAPVIKKVSVASGVAQGQTNAATDIVITGTNFDSGDTVWFGSVQGDVTDSATPGQLTVQAPANGEAGPVKITVVNSAGGASTSKTSFTAYYNPSATAGAPLLDTQGDGLFGGKAGGSITISGSHLTGVNSVSFTGAAKTVKPKASKTPDSSFSVSIPKDAANGDITISNPAGTSTLSGFTLLTLKPTGITGPATAHKGDTITLNTTGSFWAASSVKIGGKAATIVSIAANGSSMQVTVPTDPKLKLAKQAIAVVTPTGSGSASITLN